jgi:ATP-dependent DNA helicase RecG
MASYAADECTALPIEQRAGALLALTEDQWFDRKSARIAPKDLAQELVGFANAEGGTIVVGLRNGEVEDVRASPMKENELRQAALDLTTPPVRARVKSVEVVTPAGRSARLLAFSVAPGEHVHETTRGDCFLRVGDETRKLSFAQRQELSYDRGASKFDGEPVHDVDVADLSAKQLDAYAGRIGASSEADRLLMARSLLTARGRVTIAAYLLFHDHPQNVLPQAHVRVLRYRGVEAGTGSRQSLDADGDVRLEGSIPTMIYQAAAVIEEWMPRRRALGPSGTFEDRPILPRDAWLEGLVNAVVHRSYSLAGDHIRVSMFPDRIEIESPGRFPGLADPRHPLEIARYARNPRIARVCSDLHITQELGEGIRRIFDEMRALGLTDPIYAQTSGSVKLTLTSASRLDPAVAARLPVGSSHVLRAMRQAGRPLGTGEVMELIGRSRPWVTEVLHALRKEGEVEWSGKSAKDPRATWSLAVRRDSKRH